MIDFPPEKNRELLLCWTHFTNNVYFSRDKREETIHHSSLPESHPLLNDTMHYFEPTSLLQGCPLQRQGRQYEGPQCVDKTAQLTLGCAMKMDLV